MEETAANLESRLVQRIHAGDQSSWNDLIHSFHKRLFAFAKRQVDRREDADDLVQETFLSFFKVTSEFRLDCELETFLFQILRRRIVDFYRSTGRKFNAWHCVYDEAIASDPYRCQTAHPLDPAMFWQRIERTSEIQSQLSKAIRQVTQQLCQRNKFRDLQIAEATLYATLGNQEVARLLGCTPSRVALVKHRIINKLSQMVSSLSRPDQSEWACDAEFPGMLANAWESQRPSCPKRTTLGKHILGLLSDQWGSHVRFHVECLGCRFCQANLDELNGSVDAHQLDTSDQLFQSTVGFLKLG